MKGRVNGVSASILVDTGAATTVLNKCMWDHAKEQGMQLQSKIEQKLVGVQGTPLHFHGSARIQLELPPEKFWVNVIVADTPTADVILGHDFLLSQRCTIEMGSASDILHVQTRGQSVSIAQGQAPYDTSSLNVVLQDSATSQ